MKILYSQHPSRGLLEHLLGLASGIDGQPGIAYEEARYLLAAYGYELTPTLWESFGFFFRPGFSPEGDTPELETTRFAVTHDLLNKLEIVDARGNFQQAGYDRFLDRLEKWGVVAKPSASVTIWAKQHIRRFHQTSEEALNEEIATRLETRHPLHPAADLQTAAEAGPPPATPPLVITFSPFEAEGNASTSALWRNLGESLEREPDYHEHPPHPEANNMYGFGWGARYFLWERNLFAEGNLMIGSYYSQQRIDYPDGFRQIESSFFYAMGGSLGVGVQSREHDTAFPGTDSVFVMRRTDLKLVGRGFLDEYVRFSPLPPTLLVEEKLLQIGPLVISGSVGHRLTESQLVYGARTYVEF